MENIKTKTINAMGWSFLQKFGYQSVQFLISVILARILTPSEFGILAMIWILISFGQSLIDSGFGAALIQNKNASYIDECSIFYFNIFIGFIAAAFMFMMAPYVSRFYGKPVLLPVTRVMSITLIINSFGTIQSAMLNKLIDFKTQMKVSVISGIISGIIGITMALTGFGVWSLVAQAISINLFSTSLLWLLNKWRPSLKFSFYSLKKMFSFGSRILLSGLLNSIFVNLHSIVIGKIFSAATLGYYSRAVKLQELPVSLITSTVNSVTFPVFSVLVSKDDKYLFKSAVRKALSLIVTVCFPIMVGLFVVSKPLVLVFFTSKWEPCIPYLKLLCLAGLIEPLQGINRSVLLAKGRSDLYFRLSIIKKACIALAILITFRFGIIYIIYGQIVSAIIEYLLNSYYTGKIMSYTMFEQIRDLLPSLIMATLMGIVISFFSLIHSMNFIVTIGCQISFGILIYMLLCSLFKIPYFLEFLKIVKLKIALIIPGLRDKGIPI